LQDGLKWSVGIDEVVEVLHHVDDDENEKKRDEAEKYG